MNVPSYPNVSHATTASPTVIPVNIELVRGTEAQIINELLPLVKQGSVALDLSRVGRIVAAGIAALITLYCSAMEAGNDFSVVAPSSHVLELLRIVGLEAILIANCRANAVDSPHLSRSAA